MSDVTDRFCQVCEKAISNALDEYDGLGMEASSYVLRDLNAAGLAVVSVTRSPEAVESTMALWNSEIEPAYSPREFIEAMWQIALKHGRARP